MAADETRKRTLLKNLLLLRWGTSCCGLLTKLGLFLRAKNRNHLDLKSHGFAQPANSDTVAAKTECAKVVDEWDTRRNKENSED